jgi:transcriptional regulator
MYVPKYFKQEDLDSIQQLIESNGFGILVSQLEGKLWATHIPMELERVDNQFYLFGHISKANKQFNGFMDDQEVMVIFQGAHAYISSSWYNHENVPTWNYEAVHLYGNVKKIVGDALKAKLAGLIDKYEKSSKNPVSMDKLSPEFVDKEMRGIIGFEIRVTEIQGASKLSQNRDDENQERIIKGLEEQGDKDSLIIASKMKK